MSQFLSSERKPPKLILIVHHRTKVQMINSIRMRRTKEERIKNKLKCYKTNITNKQHGQDHS